MNRGSIKRNVQVTAIYVGTRAVYAKSPIERVSQRDRSLESSRRAEIRWEKHPHPCQGRFVNGGSKPASGRSKSRPLVHCGGATRGPSPYRRLGGVGGEDFAGIGIDGEAGIRGELASAPGLGVFQAIGVAVHFQDMDVVGEPVEECAGQALGAEHAGPFLER